MSSVSSSQTRPAPLAPVPDVHVYPVGDFRTMPSTAHERARTVTAGLLGSVVAPDDLVGSELAVLWNPDDRREHLIPDIMVALGVGDLDPIYRILRRQYRIWHERKPPDLILEYASPSTAGRDMLGKKEDYAGMGVREYVQFDPLEEAFRPGLIVYRLRGNVYHPVPAGADGAVPSMILPAYEWLKEGIYLRLRERKTKRLVPTAEEARIAAEAAQQAAEARAAAAERDAMAAAEEIARLRAELARLRAVTGE